MEQLIQATPELTGMPPNLLLKILGYADWKSLFVLRKVCWTLRNFIMAHKPNMDVSYICFRVRRNRIEFYFDRSLNSDFYGTQLDRFFSDIAIIMDHVKKEVSRLEVRLHPGSDQNILLVNFLWSYLRGRDQKLRVKRFETNALNFTCPIFENLDEYWIKHIETRFPEPALRQQMLQRPTTRSVTRRQVNHRFLSLENPDDGGSQPSHRLPVSNHQNAMEENQLSVVGDRVKRSPCWRRGYHIHVYGTAEGTISDYCHFVQIHVKFETLTTDQFITVKEAFVDDARKGFFDIRYETLIGWDQWIESFGPGAEIEGRQVWFFKCSYEDLIVECNFMEGRGVFRNLPKSRVPEDANIQD